MASSDPITKPSFVFRRGIASGGVFMPQKQEGGDDRLSYVHTQAAPLSTWVVTHNLGFYPSVTVVDTTRREIEGDVVHDSINQATIFFSAAFSGSAFFS
jgi:hypothetical protein